MIDEKERCCLDRDDYNKKEPRQMLRSSSVRHYFVTRSKCLFKTRTGRSMVVTYADAGRSTVTRKIVSHIYIAQRRDQSRGGRRWRRGESIAIPRPMASA